VSVLLPSTSCLAAVHAEFTSQSSALADYYTHQHHKPENLLIAASKTSTHPFDHGGTLLSSMLRF